MLSCPLRACVVADTHNALTLREAAYPPVPIRFPVRTLISPSWNGRITLPTVRIKAIAITTAFPLERKKSVNAVWSYDNPFPAVTQIKGHVCVLSRPSR